MDLSAENKSIKEVHSKQSIFAAAKSIKDLYVKQGISAMATTGSTTAVAESPRVSMMVKAGLNFVIPKNKLSGAMVPVNRSGTKWEPMDPKKEDPKPPARKTKWGLDLTQDPVVKRGRALALQVQFALSDVGACLVLQILSRLERSSLPHSWNPVTWILTTMRRPALLRLHPFMTHWDTE